MGDILYYFMTSYDLLYKKDFYGNALFHKHFTDRKLSFRVFENAVILPINELNTICAFDENGNYIQDSSPEPGAESIAKDLFANSEIANSDSSAVFLGRFIDVWGHFITNVLSRIWFLKSEDYNPGFFGAYCGFNPKQNHKRFLEILGIDCEKILDISRPTRFRKIIVPDECFITEYDDCCEGNLKFMFTQEYRNLIDCVRDYANAHKTQLSNHKFYMSYSHYKSGKSVGENHIEKFLRRHAYEIIFPEKLTLDEQLNVLANCTDFASTIGSCSHNMLFLNDGANVLLIPRANYLTPYQLLIDQVHDLSVNYVDSTFSILAASWNPGEGPFLYYVSENLRKFFGDASCESAINLRDYRKYMNYAMGMNFGRRFGFNSGGGNPDTHDYYSGRIASYYYGELLKSGLPIFRRVSNFAREIVRKYFMRYVAK